MNKTIDAQVRCPFYRREEGFNVGCEGIIDGTNLISRFRTGSVKSEFMQKYCVKAMGRGCPVAERLNEKYEKSEEK